jgi:hypothetical protein
MPEAGPVGPLCVIQAVQEQQAWPLIHPHRWAAPALDRGARLTTSSYQMAPVSPSLCSTKLLITNETYFLKLWTDFFEVSNDGYFVLYSVAAGAAIRLADGLKKEV